LRSLEEESERELSKREDVNEEKERREKKDFEKVVRNSRWAPPACCLFVDFVE